VVVAAAALVGWSQRDRLLTWLRDSGHVRSVVAVEALFLGTFALFTVVRALNPAISWGEKPMDSAILNAFLRSTTAPPADPWFAGETLNYFYFGHALTGIFSNLSGVPAAFAFNLAIAGVAALLATAAFLFFRQVGLPLAAALGGAAALVVLGNLAGPWLLLTGVRSTIGFDYFWSTSRVIPGTINEYPFWSLAFADLHAHVLSMPLEASLLYAGALWLTGGRNGSRSERVVPVVLSAWLLGAVAVTSSWSAPAAAAMQLGILLTAWRAAATERRSTDGRATWPRLFGTAALWLGIVVAARVLFAPFWRHYSGPPANWGWLRSEAASASQVAIIFGLFGVMGFPALAASLRRHLRPMPLASVAVTALTIALAATWFRSGACAVFATVAFVAVVVWLCEEDDAVRTGALLVAAAAAVGTGTELLFVWDRMNTVFKFYLQMWLLLSCGCGLLAWDALRRSSGAGRLALVTAQAVVVAGALFTSLTGFAGLIREPRMASPVPTLDGTAYLAAAAPAEQHAYEWLNQNVAGIPVILEAHGPSYQAYSRVSMNTGLPTVVGWEYHLFQQSRSRADIEARAAEVEELYNTTDLGRAAQLLERYHIDLIFVGGVEKRTYQSQGLAKFEGWPAVERVFKDRDVTIYGRPGLRSVAKTWIESVPRAVSAPNLREPRGVAMAPDGTFFVADFGNRRVRHVDAEARRIADFGSEGGGPAEFRDPCGIAVDTDGTLWVADTWNHRIQKLSADGRQLGEWHGELFGPRGIAAAKDGAILITDTGNHRVLRFTATGERTIVVPPGVLNNPVGIGLDARGDIYVADAGHRRVVVFSRDGHQLREWPIGPADSSNVPEPYLAVGPDGVVWVSDPERHRVLLFDRSGAPLGAAESSVPLDRPLGIAVVGARQALVTDAGANRLVTVRRP
jgi:YYY domain-containing protein